MNGQTQYGAQKSRDFHYRGYDYRITHQDGFWGCEVDFDKRLIVPAAMAYRSSAMSYAKNIINRHLNLGR